MKRRLERGMMREGGFVCGKTFWWEIVTIIICDQKIAIHSIAPTRLVLVKCAIDYVIT